MNLRFVKLDPCGNTTVFILDPVGREQYAAIAAAVMRHGSIGAEQVGFITPSKYPEAAARMEMMGGEFCGNASRCFAAWLALCPPAGHGPHAFNGQRRLLIDVSGCQGLLEAELTGSRYDNQCLVSIIMPLPEEIRHVGRGPLGAYSIVAFAGINHLILWDRPAAASDIDAARGLLRSNGFRDETFGVMFYDLGRNFLRPVVCVGQVGSLVWESSCGSGSSAVAAALADRRQSGIRSLPIAQPGGKLILDVTHTQGRIEQIRLGGDISITAAGTLYLDHLEL